MTEHGHRGIYELLTGRIAPYASEGETLRFDRIVREAARGGAYDTR